MKLTIARNTLVSAMGAAARIVERRNTIPIISNVRLRADGKNLEITSTDLDIELRVDVAAAIATSGETTVSSANLHDIARKLPDGADIAIEADEGRMTLRAGRTRFTLNTLPASDFPDIAEGQMDANLRQKGADLARALGKVSFAISTEETRYYLNGVYMHPDTVDGATVLAFVATDGHRLARLRLPLHAGYAFAGVIIPRKTVGVMALLAEDAPEVQLAIGATKLAMEFGGGKIAGRLVSKLVDGTFPDYSRVIPTANTIRAVVDASALKGAIDRVASISSERGRAVKFAFGETLTLSVVNPDSGDARDEIDCEVDGAPIEIGFNARYALDLINAIDGDTMRFRLADAGSPAIVESPANADFLTVLMPMRV